MLALWAGSVAEARLAGTHVDLQAEHSRRRAGIALAARRPMPLAHIEYDEVARRVVALHDEDADRAVSIGTVSAARLARRHLREIFARTGAAQPSGRLPPPLVPAAEPIFAAIAAVRSTERAFTASLKGLDENDTEAVRRADKAGETNDRAVAALYALIPTMVAGLQALIRHYAEDAEAFEPGKAGTLNLAHLARIVVSNAPS